MININNWFYLSILAALFFSLAEITYKFSECTDINSEMYVSLMWIIGGIISLVFFIYKKFYKKSITYNIISKICLISLLVFLGNIVYWRSTKNNNNPGLTRGIFAGALIIILICNSVFIFNNKLNLGQIIGIISIIIGTSLIGIYSDTNRTIN